jgi:hypothetical protein
MRFSKAAGKRLARAALRVERMRIGDGPGTIPRSAGAPAAPVLFGIVTTAIPTGTLDAPSNSGRIAVHRWQWRTSSSVADADPRYGSLPVWNRFTLSASIAVNKCVAVAWEGGAYFLIAADCP